MCEKLKHIGFSMNGVSFNKDFPTTRIQLFIIKVKEGVSQRAKLGPLFFLMYLIDMTN